MGVRLSNKQTVITGAGAGIGRKTAEYFNSEGAVVWATDINLEALEQLKFEVPGIEVFKLDVTQAENIASLVSKTGDIDVLFNCAGYVHNGAILDCDWSAWQNSLALNVTACFQMIQAFLPGMIRQGRGSIINMSSVASSIKGVANRCAYSTSKAAVIGLTKSIATDYVKQGVRCNAICPGTVDTPSLRQRIAEFPDPEQAMKQFVARQPMGRLGTDQEIAALAVYLASDESAYMTGSAMTIDGGWSN